MGSDEGVGVVGKGENAVEPEAIGSAPDDDVAVLQRDALGAVGAFHAAELKRRWNAE
jgi:hypothetical protein